MTTTNRFRIEHDIMGEVRVPVDALYGAQTQRALENFTISGLTLPRAMIRALGLIKGGYAAVNRDLGLLKAETAEAIETAATEVADGVYDRDFPVDVFQTGSGTSSNMNANEVIARLASDRAGSPVHPNDQVNLGQSSNDVFPSALRLAACLRLTQALLPALDHLAFTIEARADELRDVVKTGRTHLMDAMPLRMDQELGGWAAQIRSGAERIEASLPRLAELPLGGTAVGTGVNAPPELGPAVTARLAKSTGLALTSARNLFEGISSLDAVVEMSGQLRVLAVSLMKIANDIRWMNSGPLAGLGEISLPALQPGSSIMPGKVNPVIPEAVAMVCAQVMGNDVTIAIAGGSGNFQLNVMLPVAAHNLIQSIELLSGASVVLADRVIAGFVVHRERLSDAVDRNPILVTALNPVIGYERGAAIAKRAYHEGRPVKEVAREMTDLSGDELDRRLDPAHLTEGGLDRT
jgi:fumarate hydratase class II